MSAQSARGISPPAWASAGGSGIAKMCAGFCAARFAIERRARYSWEAFGPIPWSPEPGVATDALADRCPIGVSRRRARRLTGPGDAVASDSDLPGPTHSPGFGFGLFVWRR